MSEPKVEIATIGNEWLARIKALKITNDEEFVNSGQGLQKLTGDRKLIEEHHAPSIASAYKAHKDAVALLKTHTTPMIEAENLLKTKLIAYDSEQKRKAQQEAAERAAKVAAAEAELRRKAAEEAANTPAGTDDIPVDDSELEAADLAQETAITEQALAAVPEAVAPVKVKGLNIRPVWVWTVVDPSKLNPLFLMPDEKKIGAVVKSLGDKAEDTLGKGAVKIEQQSAMRVSTK